MFYFMKGGGTYNFINIGTRERKDIEVVAGDRIIIQPGIAHRAFVKAGTIMIEPTADPYVSAEVNDIPWTKW